MSAMLRSLARRAAEEPLPRMLSHTREQNVCGTKQIDRHRLAQRAESRCDRGENCSRSTSLLAAYSHKVSSATFNAQCLRPCFAASRSSSLFFQDRVAPLETSESGEIGIGGLEQAVVFDG